MVVGDSVAMHLCNFLQCGSMQGTDCDYHCAHRRDTEPCWERQANRSGNVFCVSNELFFGPQIEHGLHEHVFPYRGRTFIFPTRGVLWAANALNATFRAANILAAMERNGMGKKLPGVTDVVVFSSGLHDGTLDWEYFYDAFVSPGQGGSWDALLGSALEAPFDRAVWVSQMAIHKWVADTTDCRDLHPPESGKANCIRNDYDGKIYLSNPRMEYLNEFVRHTVLPRLRDKWVRQGKRINEVDAWRISQVREDNTMSHSDQAHPCDEVYREVVQVLLHLLCS
eukprot:SM000085S23210  [mRNA]  locus=s85:82521:83582:+ [translate_table: standard]